MKAVFKSCKGSVAVFLSIVLISMILFCTVVVDAAGYQLAVVKARRMLQSSQRSLLAEYNLDLKKDYGLFAINLDEGEATGKLEGYLNENLWHKGEKKQFIQTLGVDSLENNLTDMSLINVENFEKEVIKAGKYSTADGILDWLGEHVDVFSQTAFEIETTKKNMKEEEVLSEPATDEEKEIQKKSSDTIKTYENKSKKTEEQLTEAQENGLKGTSVLKNAYIIEGLPSKGIGKYDNLIGTVKDGIGLLEEGNLFDAENVSQKGQDVKNLIYVNQYILNYFGYKTKEDGNTPSFFKNEVEYILYGGFDDKNNGRRFVVDLVALRTALNMAHIYGDTVKRNLVTELSLAMTGGTVASIPVQLAITTAWAMAESLNDLKVLNEGGEIPLIKKNDDWFISFEGLINGTLENEGTKKESTTIGALSYSGYLNLFLILMNKEVKYLRMLDLIQMNMKGRYNGTFNVKTCYTGIQTEAELTSHLFFTRRKVKVERHAIY